MSKPTFTVSGSAQRHREPERGTVTVRISVTGPDRDLVTRTATDTHNRIEASARVYRDSDAATWHSASPVTTHTYLDYSSKKPVCRFAAGSVIKVKFQDFEELTEWLAILGSESDIQTGVSWDLTRATRLALEEKVRGEAVKEARRIAEQFAAGDGLSGVQLVSITGDSQEDRGYRSYGSSMLRGGLPGAASAPAPVAVVEPENITVSAKVIAVFKVTNP